MISFENVGKKIAAATFVLVMLITFIGFSHSPIARADESNISEKSWVITDSAGRNGVVEQPPKTAFWEYPLLASGEKRTGTLKVVNDTENPMDVMLEEVVFSFISDPSVRYMQGIHTVIHRGDKLVFEGDFIDLASYDLSQILSTTLAPKETVEFNISMRCEFAYSGDVYDDTNDVTWRFVAADHLDEVSTVTLTEKLKTPIIVFSCVLVAAIILAIILRITQKHRLNKEKTE